MLFIEYPRCSTCKKARQFLVAHGFEFESRDIVLNTPSYEELKQIYLQSGLPINKFFNSSGHDFRALGLLQQFKTMSEDEILHKLVENGLFIKRPILILDDGTVITGFHPSTWEKKVH